MTNRRNSMLWRVYAIMYDSLKQVRPYMALQERILTMLEQGSAFESNSVIADVACGTCNFAELVAQRHPGFSGRIIAVDASPAMCKRAHGKLRQRKIKNVTVVSADLNRPLSDQGLNEPVDWIVFVNGVYALNDPRWTIHELASIMKSGGRMVFTTPLESASISSILREHRKLAREQNQPPRIVRLVLSQVPLLMINLLILRNPNFHYPSLEEVRNEWFGEGSGWGLVGEELTRVYGLPGTNVLGLFERR